MQKGSFRAFLLEQDFQFARQQDPLGHNHLLDRDELGGLFIAGFKMKAESVVHQLTCPDPCWRDLQRYDLGHLQSQPVSGSVKELNPVSQKAGVILLSREQLLAVVTAVFQGLDALEQFQIIGEALQPYCCLEALYVNICFDD